MIIKKEALEVIWNLRESKSFSSFNHTVKLELSESVIGAVSELDQDRCLIWLNSKLNLTTNQLYFILAHELSHILNGDQRWFRRYFKDSVKKEIEADLLASKGLKELNIRLSEYEIDQMFSPNCQFQSPTHPQSSKRNKYLKEAFKVAQNSSK